MINKVDAVYEVLITPISVIADSNSNGQPKIERVNSIINTTQTYRRSKDYPKNLDADMSDFAVSFYSIIYKNILKDGRILGDDNNFSSDEFCGDTMTSASILTSLKDKYHCLANFWILPMQVGRTSKYTHSELKKWSKTSNFFGIQDFMDRFLLLLKNNYKTYQSCYKKFFGEIQDFKTFAELEFLVGSYVDSNFNILQYSDVINSKTSDIAFELIKLRAKTISESEYCDELWEYFKSIGLIKLKEEYLEADEYPIDYELYPNGYSCSKCGRFIKNEENYSIPDMCDICAENN